MGRRERTCDSFSTLIWTTGPYLDSTSPLMSSARSRSQSRSVSLQKKGKRSVKGWVVVYTSEGRKRDALGRVEDVADQHVKRRLGREVRSVPARQTRKSHQFPFKKYKMR